MRNPSVTRLKKTAFDLGVDLCGIASVERFSGAPKGFHPDDISKGSKSVLVFAKKLPAGSMRSSSCIPYTFANKLITDEVDALTLVLSRKFEEMGVENVPVPSDDPSEHWEPGRTYARGILSLRHAAFFAGLGVLGKNTLLVNDRFGNMIQIGALLLKENFKPDPIASYKICRPDCKICLRACPQSALDGITVDQKACRTRSILRTERGFILKKCWICRMVCPYHAGLSRKKE